MYLYKPEWSQWKSAQLPNQTIVLSNAFLCWISMKEKWATLTHKDIQRHSKGPLHVQHTCGFYVFTVCVRCFITLIFSLLGFHSFRLCFSCFYGAHCTLYRKAQICSLTHTHTRTHVATSYSVKLWKGITYKCVPSQWMHCASFYGLFHSIFSLSLSSIVRSCMIFNICILFVVPVRSHLCSVRSSFMVATSAEGGSQEWMIHPTLAYTHTHTLATINHFERENALTVKNLYLNVPDFDSD